MPAPLCRAGFLFYNAYNSICIGDIDEPRAILLFGRPACRRQGNLPAKGTIPTSPNHNRPQLVGIGFGQCSAQKSAFPRLRHWAFRNSGLIASYA